MKAIDIIIKMWENNDYTKHTITVKEYSEKTGLYGNELIDSIKKAHEIQLELFLNKLKRLA